MRTRWVAPVLAWSLVGLLVVMAAVAAQGILRGDGAGTRVALDAAWIGLGLVYGVVGAFLVTRVPGNVIGWLLIGPAIAVGLGGAAAMTLAAAPPHLTLGLFLLLCFDNVSWVFLIFPVMLLLSLFPTGHPPSSKWKWHPYLIGAMTLAMVVLSASSKMIGPLEGDWVIANPVGFIATEDGSTFQTWFTPIWTVLLLVITVGGVTALTVRYRRGRWAERQQIKVLLFALAIFGVVYAVGALANEWAAGWLLDLFLIPAMIFIPITMAVAVLRHRLFDIDVIIRRTVVYVMVMALLIAVFTGSVLVAQGVVRRVTGQESSLAVAASTLVAAALFAPLRRRIHRAVGRRFFRGGYDPEQVVASFAGLVRNETDVGALKDDLVTAVVDTLHPRSVAVSLVGGRSTPAGGTFGTGPSRPSRAGWRSPGR